VGGEVSAVARGGARKGNGRKPGAFVKFGEAAREKYLRALSEGHNRQNAAKAAGVSAELVRLYRKAAPEFEAAERGAEIEASGVVENALFKKAKGGSVAACKFWLCNRAAERWKQERNLKLTLRDVLALLPPELAGEVGRLLPGDVPGGNGRAPAPAAP
jgi:hypothetical protein